MGDAGPGYYYFQGIKFDEGYGPGPTDRQRAMMHPNPLPPPELPEPCQKCFNLCFCCVFCCPLMILDLIFNKGKNTQKCVDTGECCLITTSHCKVDLASCCSFI